MSLAQSKTHKEEVLTAPLLIPSSCLALKMDFQSNPHTVNTVETPEVSWTGDDVEPKGALLGR